MSNFVIFEKWAVERVRWSALIAIGDGLKSRGHKVEYFVPSAFSIDKPDMPDTPEGEIDGIFTWHWNYFEIPEYYSGKTDIHLVDQAFLGRSRGYHFILRNGAFPTGKPSDRFEALRMKPVSKWSADGHILVCTQNHHLEWYKETVDKLCKLINGKREIRMRHFTTDKPLKDDLKGCYALVTFNSTCLYEAYLHKIPVFCDRSCPASVACETDVDKRILDMQRIEDPVPFLSNVAYSQWTLDEMRRGIFLD